MIYLIDTHALIWVLTSVKNLSKKSKKILFNRKEEVYISCITLWEISLKFHLRKLSLQNKKPDEVLDAILDMGFKILDLDSKSASTFYKLPIVKNKDPFDRMLVWQAIKGDYVLISKDSGFDAYKSFGLRRVW